MDNSEANAMASWEAIWYSLGMLSRSYVANP